MLKYQNDDKIFKIFYDSEGCMIHITHGDNNDFISIPYEKCLEAKEKFRELFKNFPKSEFKNGYIYKKDDITSLKVKSGQASFKLKIDEIVYNFTDKYEIASISKFLEGWWVKLSSNNTCNCMISEDESYPETPVQMDEKIKEESVENNTDDVDKPVDNVVDMKKTSSEDESETKQKEDKSKEKESDSLDDDLNDFLSSDDFLSDIDLGDA